MPRPPRLDPLHAAIQSIGQQIGAELAAAISTSVHEASGQLTRTAPALLGGAAPRTGRRGRRPLSAVEAPCSVPGCSRKRAAKGLCQNHYAKAKRLELRVDALTDADRRTLAADLRAQRGRR